METETQVRMADQTAMQPSNRPKAMSDKASEASACAAQGDGERVGECASHMHPQARQPQGSDLIVGSLSVGEAPHFTAELVKEWLRRVKDAYG